MFIGENSFLESFINYVYAESCVIDYEDDGEMKDNVICDFIGTIKEFMNVVSILGLVTAVIFVCYLK